MKVLVLGAGLVGRPMAMDLSQDEKFEVAIADINKKNLEKISDKYNIQKIESDLSNKIDLRELLQNYDIVLNAVPGFMGFETLKEIITAGKNVVDIAFSPEDTIQLDELAKSKNVTALVDCGVAPGMSNLLAGYAYSILDETETILIYVGGLPSVREYPFEYKAPFSPIDVIEEYTRPARYVENGNLIIKPALSDPELMNFPEVGTLEAFNSDGLRSLAFTLNVPNMKEKTLRYPGHIEKMKILREVGFFSSNEIEIKGNKIKPIDLTSKLLFPMWELKSGDEEFTIMKIIVEGEKENKKLRYVYNLLDRYDSKSKVHSMARTTGYTATTAIRMLAEGLFEQKGVYPPEFIGQNQDCVNFMLKGLQERGVYYDQVIENI
ncbi:MAG: saccharopine dehydrogenase family protein [Ignavibacteriales bacterium]|nr:saccharopine dehydrogenase family protein [Ignavibacteriales bacterium]